MKRAFLTTLGLALALAVLVPVSLPSASVGLQEAFADSDKNKKYKAVVTDSRSQKTTLKNATVRAGQSLFGSGSGKKILEVKKDGGPLKIKVKFSKIQKIRIVRVNPDNVEIEIIGKNKAKLKGTVPSNLELLGETDFGEASIRIRDAKEIEISG